jgi:hypothetical protein
MRRWDVLFRSHFLGIVRADDEASALEAACLSFGQHMRDALVVKERGF